MVLRPTRDGKVNTAHFNSLNFSSWGKKLSRIKERLGEPTGKKKLHCQEVEGIRPVTEIPDGTIIE